MTWQVIHGDCRDVMATMAPGSVDLVLADPPYGETSLDWDKPVERWLPLVLGLLKPGGSLWCFGSLRFFMERRLDFAGWSLAQDVVWEKHNGSNFAADRFRRVHEHAVQFYPSATAWADVYKDPQTTPDAVKKQVRRKGRPRHLGTIGESTYISEDGGPRLMRSVIYARSCHGRAIHPTQKPEAILEPLIRYSCPRGGVVLDPFCGSGSGGRATLRVGGGRSFIGIELGPSRAEAARQHIIADAPLMNRAGSV